MKLYPVLLNFLDEEAVWNCYNFFVNKTKRSLIYEEGFYFN